jgi:NAD(P)-dependent dehydrogenase (short-subunit alcohol dehydrogenase family)
LRVNALAPGPFHSEGAAERLWPEESMRRRLVEQNPQRRLGTAVEMAAHALYLLSPACEHVNGECFVVDGGLSLGRGMWVEGERARRAGAPEA